MSDVLGVQAVQLGDPLSFGIFVEPENPAVH